MTADENLIASLTTRLSSALVYIDALERFVEAYDECNSYYDAPAPDSNLREARWLVDEAKAARDKV